MIPAKKNIDTSQILVRVMDKVCCLLSVDLHLLLHDSSNNIVTFCFDVDEINSGVKIHNINTFCVIFSRINHDAV